MKWNECCVVQYGNMQYSNTVVKMEKSIFCLLKVAIVGGRFRLRPPKEIFLGGRPPEGGRVAPVPPIVAAHDIH